MEFPKYLTRKSNKIKSIRNVKCMHEQRTITLRQIHAQRSAHTHTHIHRATRACPGAHINCRAVARSESGSETRVVKSSSALAQTMADSVINDGSNEGVLYQV